MSCDTNCSIFAARLFVEDNKLPAAVSSATLSLLGSAYVKRPLSTCAAILVQRQHRIKTKSGLVLQQWRRVD